MIVKRSITIRGHRTSISIEDAFWTRLQSLAAERRIALAALVALIDTDRTPGTNLSSAIRLFVLAEALHGRAGRSALSDAEEGADMAIETAAPG